MSQRNFDAFILYVLKVIHWLSGFEALMNKNLSLGLLELSALFLMIYFLKYVIKDVFNLNYIFRFSFCLLLFFGLRIGFNFYNLEKAEVLVHHFYKDKIISIKNKDKVDFWIHENRNEKKIIDFLVDPYLISRRVDECDVNYYSEESKAFVYEGKHYKLK